MSSSRSRSRTTPTGWPMPYHRRIVSTGSGQVVLNAMMNHPSGSDFSPCSFDKAEYSSITDVVTAPNEKRVYNPVSHERNLASLVFNEVTNYWPAPVPEYAQTSITREIGPYVSYVSGFPAYSPPWASLLNSLAGSLNGSVACGSLLAVTVKEAAATIRMLRNPFELLKPHWRKIAEKNSFSALLKKGSNVWLEGLYGWKAGYGDVKSIAKTITKLADPSVKDSLEADTQRFSAATTETLSGASWYYPNNTVGFDSVSDTGFFSVPRSGYGNLRIRKLGVEVTSCVSCRQVRSMAQRYNRSMQAMQAFGLDLGSVVDVLWEIVPMSFVIDWFVDPLGLWHLPGSFGRLHWLDVLDLGYSVRKKGSYKAQFFFSDVASSIVGGPWYTRTPSTTSGKLDASIGHYYSYSRTPGSPSWSALASSLTGSGLSMTKNITGLALGIQRILR